MHKKSLHSYLGILLDVNFEDFFFNVWPSIQLQGLSTSLVNC